jgi:hypothetical protein
MKTLQVQAAARAGTKTWQQGRGKAWAAEDRENIKQYREAHPVYTWCHSQRLLVWNAVAEEADVFREGVGIQTWTHSNMRGIWMHTARIPDDRKEQYYEQCLLAYHNGWPAAQSERASMPYHPAFVDMDWYINVKRCTRQAGGKYTVPSDLVLPMLHTFGLAAMHWWADAPDALLRAEDPKRCIRATAVSVRYIPDVSHATPVRRGGALVIKMGIHVVLPNAWIPHSSFSTFIDFTRTFLRTHSEWQSMQRLPGETDVDGVIDDVHTMRLNYNAKTKPCAECDALRAAVDVHHDGHPRSAPHPAEAAFCTSRSETIQQFPELAKMTTFMGTRPDAEHVVTDSHPPDMSFTASKNVKGHSACKGSTLDWSKVMKAPKLTGEAKKGAEAAMGAIEAYTYGGGRSDPAYVRYVVRNKLRQSVCSSSGCFMSERADPESVYKLWTVLRVPHPRELDTSVTTAWEEQEKTLVRHKLDQMMFCSIRRPLKDMERLHRMGYGVPQANMGRSWSVMHPTMLALRDAWRRVHGDNCKTVTWMQKESVKRVLSKWEKWGKNIDRLKTPPHDGVIAYLEQLFGSWKAKLAKEFDLSRKSSEFHDVEAASKIVVEQVDAPDVIKAVREAIRTVPVWVQNAAAHTDAVLHDVYSDAGDEGEVQFLLYRVHVAHLARDAVPTPANLQWRTRYIVQLEGPMARYCMHGRRFHACVHSGAFLILHPRHHAMLACGCRSSEKKTVQVRQGDAWVVAPGLSAMTCMQWSIILTSRRQKGDVHQLTHTARNLLWPDREDTMTSITSASGTTFHTLLSGGDGDSRPAFSTLSRQPSMDTTRSGAPVTPSPSNHTQGGGGGSSSGGWARAFDLSKM